MLLLAIAAVIVGVVIIGFALNWFVARRSHTDPKEGASVQNILVATSFLPVSSWPSSSPTLARRTRRLGPQPSLRRT